jgi:hypothetical protein
MGNKRKKKEKDHTVLGLVHGRYGTSNPHDVEAVALCDGVWINNFA